MWGNCYHEWKAQVSTEKSWEQDTFGSSLQGSLRRLKREPQTKNSTVIGNSLSRLLLLNNWAAVVLIGY